MKDNVLDVLVYLLDNYMTVGIDWQPNHETLTVELQEAGFERDEIMTAFTWLSELSDGLQTNAIIKEKVSKHSFRILSEDEQSKLGVDGQSLLMSLGSTGLLDANLRELIISFATQLEGPQVDVDDLKWIILLVVFHHTRSSQIYVWLHNLLFNTEQGKIH